VAQKIAAGEVIERPASAVKELIENALDAGARQVQVEIRGGGLGLIRVADDGAGIPSAESELAFARHATSKLRDADELHRIQTLGFRGEALASIAAVSQITLYTRHRDEELGVALSLDAGRVVERKPWAGAVGTTLLVRNLFFNVPARLKFLRSATGEAGQIGHLIEQFALGHPEARFRFISDGRRVLETPGSGDLRDAMRQVYGRAIADGLLAIGDISETAHLRLHGLISRPDVNRANRSALCFFVNGRRVGNPSLAFAAEEAYRPALPPGRHPIIAVHLELAPADVDCNVHPAKAEVRLVNDRLVHGAIHRAVRAALLEVAPVPEVGASLGPASWTDAGTWGGGSSENPGRGDAATPRDGGAEPSAAVAAGGAAGEAEWASRLPALPTPLGGAVHLSWMGADEAVPTAGGEGGFRPTSLRPVGQVQNTYIVAEGPGGVYFVDQHTAHERILYEEILALRFGPGAPSQALLAPVVVPLGAHQRAALLERGDALARFGFQVEEFGPDSFVIRAVPPRLVRRDLIRALQDAADALAGEATAPDGADRLAATLACHSAVRAGDPLTPEEMTVLLARLEQTNVNRYCPHGRPIVIHLPVAQLEKDFHRR
jgi:DNA mismatch repair protein MutL